MAVTEIAAESSATANNIGAAINDFSIQIATRNHLPEL